MPDEMILVPRAELLAWAKAWLNEYDPNDGTDCVTPFDTYLLKSPVVNEAMVERAWEAAMEIKHNKEPWFPMTKRRMKRALTAALAAQQGGGR